MTRAQLRAEERRWRRGDGMAVVGALLLGVVLAWIVLSVQAMGHDLRTERARGDALAAQVEGLGATPVVGPSGSQGEPGASVTGPAGLPGVTGPSGAPGPSGSPGAPGRTGSSGVAGASGSPGAPGAVGATGPVGPAGPPGVGIQGEPGATGPQGERGEKGDTGATGPAGSSCEDGYSWQTPSWDPDARVCRRDGAPDPSESPSPSVAAGLDPRRLQYV